MSQLAEKTGKREAKAVQIMDAAYKWDDPLDLEGTRSACSARPFRNSTAAPRLN